MNRAIAVVATLFITLLSAGPAIAAPVKIVTEPGCRIFLDDRFIGISDGNGHFLLQGIPMDETRRLELRREGLSLTTRIHPTAAALLTVRASLRSGLVEKRRSSPLMAGVARLGSGGPSTSHGALPAGSAMASPPAITGAPHTRSRRSMNAPSIVGPASLPGMPPPLLHAMESAPPLPTPSLADANAAGSSGLQAASPMEPVSVTAARVRAILAATSSRPRPVSLPENPGADGNSARAEAPRTARAFPSPPAAAHEPGEEIKTPEPGSRLRNSMATVRAHVEQAAPPSLKESSPPTDTTIVSTAAVSPKKKRRTASLLSTMRSGVKNMAKRAASLNPMTTFRRGVRKMARSLNRLRPSTAGLSGGIKSLESRLGRLNPLNGVRRGLRSAGRKAGLVGSSVNGAFRSLARKIRGDKGTAPKATGGLAELAQCITVSTDYRRASTDGSPVAAEPEEPLTAEGDHRTLGDSCFADGDYVNAVHHYNEVVKEEPEAAWGYRNRARALSMMQRHDMALADAEEALARSGPATKKLAAGVLATVLYERGIQHYNEEELVAAGEDIARAQSINPRVDNHLKYQARIAKALRASVE